MYSAECGRVLYEGYLIMTMLTTRQAAERLNVSSRTILVWIERGWLQAFKAGAVIRVDSAELERFIIAGCRTDNPTQPSGGSATPTPAASALDALLARKSTPTPRRKSKGLGAPTTARASGRAE